MLWFDSFLIDLSIAIGFLIIVAILYSKHIYSYWTRNKIPQLNPSFPFGDCKGIILRNSQLGVDFQHKYEEFKARGVPFGGYYFALRPELLLVDPDVIKQIMVKDFQYFTDRGTFSDEKNDPLTGHLFSLDGTKWKHLRAKLTPTFTSGKMKMMFHTLVGCSDELKNIVDEKYSISEPIDIKDILARFTTDVIGSCAFGIDTNCLRNPDADFRKYGQMSFEPKGIDSFRNIFAFIMPDVFKFFKIPALNRNITKFFMGVVKETVKYREENNIFRKDFMQLLIQLKNQGRILTDDETENPTENVNNEITSKGLTIEEIAAQCFVFFLAGFETSSTTMTFCLYELVKNPDVQEKVRQEINEVLSRHDGKMTYEAIMEMHYMEKVINETLRKYPPLAFLIRKCTKDYKLPKSDMIIRKGSMMRISVLGLQRDPEHYPEPDKFDPERFSEEQKAKRHPFAFLPFGEGPRICIGLRFGMMQSKVGLSVLLKNYKFTLNNKTQEPFIMEPNSFILSTQGGIWLDAHKVTS